MCIRDSLGAWFTGGTENIGGVLSILIEGKWHKNFDFSDMAPNTVAYDYGARVILNFIDQKFIFSGEIIWRDREGFELEMEEKNYKYVFNLNVNFSPDTKLNLTLGKDFEENEMFRKGNLLSLINLVKSFG